MRYRPWIMIVLAGMGAAFGCGAQESAGDFGGGRGPGSSGGPGDGPGADGSEAGADRPNRPPVEPVLETFAELGIVPFDIEKNDLSGPATQASWYGMLPQIVADPGQGFVDVTVRDMTKDSDKLATVRLALNDAEDWKITRAFVSTSLGNLLGFARGSDDSYFIATGTRDPEVTATNPPANAFRANIVRLRKVDPTGRALFDLDMDLEREKIKDAIPMVRPGVASTARLAVKGDMVTLVHGINTKPDDKGTRHQMALTSIVDGKVGTVRSAFSVWVSHSFDQRYLVGDESILEMHLGDAYPRAIVVSRIADYKSGKIYSVFQPAGGLGDNNTETRLGNLASIDAGAGGLLALYSTKRSTAEGAPRDLAVTRLVAGVATDTAADPVDQTLGEVVETQSAGKTVQNRMKFLTSYGGTVAEGSWRSVERPKLVALGGGRFIALYELWTQTGSKQTFEGTYGLVIDGDANVVVAEKLVTRSHIPRGDDAFVHEGALMWISGDAATRALTMHRVGADLSLSERVVK